MKIFHDHYGWIKNNVASVGEEYKVAHGGKMIDGELVGYGFHVSKYVEPVDSSVINVTFEFSKDQCALGDEVDYTITFSDPLTVDDVVPISVVNRNGVHVDNIGCVITDGVATGTFTPKDTGDFTITNAAINYHQKLILAKLELVEQPWLRVYQ